MPVITPDYDPRIALMAASALCDTGQPEIAHAILWDYLQRRKNGMPEPIGGDALALSLMNTIHNIGKMAVAFTRKIAGLPPLDDEKLGEALQKAVDDAFELFPTGLVTPGPKGTT